MFLLEGSFGHGVFGKVSVAVKDSLALVETRRSDDWYAVFGGDTDEHDEIPEASKSREG